MKKSFIARSFVVLMFLTILCHLLWLHKPKKLMMNRVKKGLLQVDTYSLMFFCYTEIPAMILLEELDGYKMGPPDIREITRHAKYV